MRTELVVGLFTAFILVSSGCMGQSNNDAPENDSSNNPGEVDAPAQNWCQSNGHGNATTEGCITEQEALQSGGIFYETSECSDSQGYACAK